MTDSFMTLRRPLNARSCRCGRVCQGSGPSRGGARWQYQPVSASKIIVVPIGVEDGPAADALQHLLVAVFMPAVYSAWGVTPGLGGQVFLAHARGDLVLARRRALMPVEPVCPS